MPKELIGEISHWFDNISVGGIVLSGELAVGDRIHIVGHTTDLEEDVSSMQLDNNDVSQASAGDEIGVRLTSRVRPGDQVYRVS